MSASPCRILSIAATMFLMVPQASAGSLLARKINPDLDPKSDKEFFGPPFPADYPSDLRPGGKHAFNYPFPHVQGSSTFDSDYVKDENSDNGEWQAQMDYDSLRAQLQKAKKEAEEANNKEQAEAAEADKAADAYKDAKRDEQAAQDAADKAAEEAKEAAEKAKDAKVEEVKDDVPLENAIEEAKKKVEDKIKNLDDCKQQLIDAQNELKALLEESQKKREEEAAVHSQEQAEAAAKHEDAKQAAAASASGSSKAQQALEGAEDLTRTLKAKFEEEKAEEDKAEDIYKKEQDDVNELEKKLKAAEDRLRTIRNGGHATASSDKSGAQTSTFSVAILALAAMVVR